MRQKLCHCDAKSLILRERERGKGVRRGKHDDGEEDTAAKWIAIRIILEERHVHDLHLVAMHLFYCCVYIRLHVRSRAVLP